MTSSNDAIILGIDPGTRITGYGVIRVDGAGYTALDYGCIRPPRNLPLPDRLLIISNGIEEIIDKYSPSAVAIETQFVHKNVQTAIKLGMARGVALVPARKRGVEVVEYTPKVAKRSVVGKGAASKEQVQGMTKQLLNLETLPAPEDAADALCLAICHAQRRKAYVCIH